MSTGCFGLSEKNSPEEREALKSIIDGMHGIVEQTKKD